jgi:hypothetical protein
MFALSLAAVEDVPEFWALVLGIPLSEAVAVGEEPLLRSSLFLIAASATQCDVGFEHSEGVEQGHDLEAIPARGGSLLLLLSPRIDRLLDRPDVELSANPLNETIAEVDRLGEVMTRVHVRERERDLGGSEGLLRQVHHENGVLAPRKEQDRPLELRGYLTHEEDRLRFELSKMGTCGERHEASVESSTRP